MGALELGLLSSQKRAIGEKLSAPTTAGTSGQVLVSDGNGGQSWQDNMSASGIADAVDAWCDENITNPSNPPLDRSLLSSSSAAPADMVGDLKNETSYGDFTKYTVNSGQINSSKAWTNATSANYKHTIIPVKSGDSIKITTGTSGTTYALLTSYSTPVNNEAVPLSTATGFNNRIAINASTTITFTVPSDAIYLLVYTLSGGSDITPVYIGRNGINILKTTIGNIKDIYDNLDSLNQSAADLVVLQGKTSYTTFSECVTNQGTFNSSGKWTNISANYLHTVVAVASNDKVAIKAQEDQATWCAVLTSYSTPVANASIPFSEATGFTAPINISENTETSFTAPSDAAYVIIGVKSGGTDITPVSVKINDIDIKQTTLDNLRNVIRKANTVESSANTANTKADQVTSSVGFSSYGSLNQTSGMINSNSKWDYVGNTSHVYTHVVFPVKSGDKIHIEESLINIGFLKSYSIPSNGDTAVFSDATGYTALKYINDSTAIYDFTVPADVNYMYVLTIQNGTATIIGKFTINGLSIKLTLADNVGKLYIPDKTIKWCAMGDSITYGYYSSFNEGGGASSHTLGREDIGWAFLVSKQNNWELTNIAIGGEGYLDVASGGGGEQGYTQARSYDFSSFDLVTIALGINDWKANKVMGSFEDDQTAETITSFIPAMRATIEAIATSNPSCKIIVITPLNSNGYEHTYGTQATNWGMGYEMSNSGTLKQFRDKMIEICELYGVQYIDMSSASCINSLALPTMLPDGVHPAIETHKLLARELAKKITF